LFGDRLIGMLALDKHEPGFYTAEHARLASAFAAQAAIAIENARLYEETKQRAEEMTALHETTLDITAQLEMPRLLNAIIARASDLLGATGGLIHLYDLARERLTAVTSYNLEKDYTGLTLAVGEGVAGKVFQAGEPLVIDDHRTWSGKSPQLVDAAARSMLGVPLKWQERVIGVLDIVDNVRVGAFAEQDLRLLMPFANQAAIAIQNARLFEETRQRAGQWEALTEVGRAIGSILDLDEVLQLVLERLKQVIPYDTVSLWLRKGEVMRTRAVRGFEASEAHLDLTVTIEEDALSQEMVSTRRPLVIADAQRDERFHGLAGTEWVRSWLGVPLLSKGEVIGLATINKREPGLYTAEMAELALAFGQQAALAIENARLYAVQRQRAAQLESLNVIAATISQVLDLDEVLNLIVCQAAELMEAETMVIPLLGEDGTHLTYAAAHGRLAADLFGLVKPLRDTGICTWVLRNKQRFYSDDLAADERAGKEMKEALGLRTVISAPMIFKGEAIGAITAINRRDGGLFTRADLEERLQPLANHAAIAIGNAHLYEETKQRAEEMTALYHTSLEIGTPTDLPNLLWTICDRAVRLLGVSKGGLYLY
ncbi:MAG: GAF domain-containing protein, partial [Chloroflexota bacterium]|nr:GAF domain-containing protein [Chloroflexota bacterium]